MEAKVVASATPHSHHSTESTTQRPPSILYERCGIGLSVDGGVGLCVGPLSVTLGAEDPSSSAQPPHHPHTSPPSFSDPGPSPLSSTSTIISETPDPTQPSSPAQPSTTSPNPPSTGESPNPNLSTTSSASSQTTTIETPTASGSPVGNGPSPTTSTGSNDGGASVSRSVVWHDLSSSTVASDPIPASTPGPYPPQTPPGNVAYPPPPSGWSPSASPSSGPPGHNLPTSHQRLSVGVIVGIALGALAALLCAALALFCLLRRRRARSLRWKRMSVESARRRLEPYSYDDDDLSRPISSVWTLFGSVSVYPELEAESEHRREPSTNSLDFQFPEKEAETGYLGAYTPGPSPCPSPGLGETRPLVRGASLCSVHSLPHDSRSVSHLDVPPPSALSLDAASSSELPVLAGKDYAVANPLRRDDGALGRSVSGVSRVTAASGDVQSVEAS